MLILPLLTRTLLLPPQVERIVILGLPAKAYTVTALVGGKESPLEASSGALSPKAPSSTAALVIRKPLLPIGSDWAVKLA
jgi:hypothetical protein